MNRTGTPPEKTSAPILSPLLLVCLAWALTLDAQGAAPANDQFANAESIADLTTYIASNVGATSEPGEPPHAGEFAESTLWWKWTVPFTATFSVVTSNSVAGTLPLDTVAAVYTGTSLSNLVYVSANDDTAYGEFGAVWSRCVFRAYAGEQLWIAVGSLGNTGTIRLTLDVAGPMMNPWSAPGLHGETLYSSNFTGQVVLIDFWETICGACIEELPALIRLQTNLFAKGFTLIGLSGDAKSSDVVDYLDGRGINYPIAMGDQRVQYTITGNVVGYPTKYLVDREGRIVGIYSGGNTEKGYRSIVEPLLRPDSRVRVGIHREGGLIKITWPSTAASFVLETSDAPSGQSWSVVETPPVTSNGENAVTVSSELLGHFYRLRQP